MPANLRCIGVLSSLACVSCVHAISDSGTSREKVSTVYQAIPLSVHDRLNAVIAVEFKNQRLEDVMRFIGERAGITLDCMWVADRDAIGMEKETLITLKASNLSVQALFERVLAAATSDTTGAFGMTWQISSDGSLQIGPRERLNKFRRVEIYDVSDLLAIVPDFTNAPAFDLNSVLQSQTGRGGGTSQSPFTPANHSTGNQPGIGVNGQPEMTKQQRAEELRSIIIQLVEPEQWEEAGSDAASIRFYQGAFIVNAPEYVHRALAAGNR